MKKQVRIDQKIKNRLDRKEPTIQSRVDQYLRLKAKLAPLLDQEKELEKLFITFPAVWEDDVNRAGKPVQRKKIEGKLGRVVVSKFDVARLNMEAVRKKLSDQFIRANTSHKDQYKVSHAMRLGLSKGLTGDIQEGGMVQTDAEFTD